MHPRAAHARTACSFMKGFVSCIKNSERKFFVITKNGQFGVSAFGSDVNLEVGEVLELGVEDNIVKKVEESNAKAEQFRKFAETAAQKIVIRKPYVTGIKEFDGATARMWKRLTQAAMLLIRKMAMATPVIIRFHNDIDGASCAYALHKATQQILESNDALCKEQNILWQMHYGVSYGVDDAANDVLLCNDYESVEKPLLVILDFGTAPESNAGLKHVKDKFEIIWLDHHTPVPEFEGNALENYINPWDFGSDSSYTAGALTCAFVKSFADVETKDIENASFIGDYSAYANPNEQSRRLASILDVLTCDPKLVGVRNLEPKAIEKILNDKTAGDELIAYAGNRITEMLDSALSSVKSYAEGTIYVADFENIRGFSKERYPLPGRFASMLLTKLEEVRGKGCTVVLHFGPYISVRTSKLSHEKVSKETNLLKTLEDIRKEYPELIDSAGGHANAASIKLRGEDGKEIVIKALLEELKSNER